MEHRHLGRSGLKVSEIAYGNWITHGSQVAEEAATACVAAAVDARRVRKLVLRALASRRELALAPERLRVEDVAAALRAESNGSADTP